MSDKVNHPAHYTQQSVECIEFAQHLNSVLYLIWVAASEKGSARTVLESALNRLAKLIGDTNERL